MAPLLKMTAWMCAVWAVAQGVVHAGPVEDLLALVPARVEAFSAAKARQLEQQAEEVDAWAAEQWWGENSPEEIVATVGVLVQTKQRVDASLEQMLQLRTRFAERPLDEVHRQRVRSYLESTSQLIDLSGRLRHRLSEVIEAAAYFLDAHPEQFHQLLDLLIQRRVDVGAIVMSYMLLDPPPESGSEGYTAQEKHRALQLINVTQQADLVPVVAEFVRREQNPALVVIGAELLRRLGLPQQPRADRDPKLPETPIVAEQLQEILEKVDSQRLSEPLRECRRDLLVWLEQRRRRGILDDVYRLGALELRAGDWLLMRNPSPYNLFTDLSPGLFTHVGVVAVEEGSDGIRRFVVVDLPERGARIPAATVDAYLARTLHYFFVRHEDPEVGRRMGEAAAEMIGNEAQFDLTFQTSRVRELAGQPLRGALIHTYCAGFLLICAQHAGESLEAFFPLAESAAGGHMQENLGGLGLSIGADFVSPTGAVFSPHVQIVGRREPMYDPAREVQQAIYDHFARRMIQRPIAPSPDAWQTLRQKLAEASRHSPWLARALARAGNVNERMDLEAAARAATVIETLDRISEGNLNAFAEASQAILLGPLTPLVQSRLEEDQVDRLRAYQVRHAELFQAWIEGRIAARQLRSELVAFYVQRGRQQLDERFFADPGSDGAPDEDRRTGRRDRGDLDRGPSVSTPA
jgi:hypothetical protein